MILIFDDIIGLLEHPVQREKAQEMRAFLRTVPSEVPLFDQ